MYLIGSKIARAVCQSVCVWLSLCRGDGNGGAV